MFFCVAPSSGSRAIGLHNRHPIDRASRQELTTVIPDPKLDVNTEPSAPRSGMSFQCTRMSADRALMAVIRTPPCHSSASALQSSSSSGSSASRK